MTALGQLFRWEGGGRDSRALTCVAEPIQLCTREDRNGSKSTGWDGGLKWGSTTVSHFYILICDSNENCLLPSQIRLWTATLRFSYNLRSRFFQSSISHIYIYICVCVYDFQCFFLSSLWVLQHIWLSSLNRTWVTPWFNIFCWHTGLIRCKLTSSTH